MKYIFLILIGVLFVACNEEEVEKPDTGAIRRQVIGDIASGLMKLAGGGADALSALTGDGAPPAETNLEEGQAATPTQSEATSAPAAVSQGIRTSADYSSISAGICARSVPQTGSQHAICMILTFYTIFFKHD